VGSTCIEIWQELRRAGNQEKREITTMKTIEMMVEENRKRKIIKTSGRRFAGWWATFLTGSRW
jgi:hypothetical protein